MISLTPEQQQKYNKNKDNYSSFTIHYLPSPSPPSSPSPEFVQFLSVVPGGIKQEIANKIEEKLTSLQDNSDLQEDFWATFLEGEEKDNTVWEEALDKKWYQVQEIAEIHAWTVPSFKVRIYQFISSLTSPQSLQKWRDYKEILQK